MQYTERQIALSKRSKSVYNAILKIERSNKTLITTALLKLLKCPVSGAELQYDRIRNILICMKSQLVYPVRDGIPLLMSIYAQKMTLRDYLFCQEEYKKLYKNSDIDAPLEDWEVETR